MGYGIISMIFVTNNIICPRGSLIAWGAFVNHKLLDLVVLEHRPDSKKYIEHKIDH